MSAPAPIPASDPPLLRRMQPTDRDAIALLIHHSTNDYYRSIGRDAIFVGPPEDAAVFVDVYDAIGPDYGLVFEQDGELLGSCFVHPRETHVSLGIMNVAAAAQGKGVARQLLARIVKDAGSRPVRLVSSCFNLDSYSLYSRAGFQPRGVVQDVLFAIPPIGPPPHASSLAVRDATPEDLPMIAEHVLVQTGLDRTADYAMMLDAGPEWTVLLTDGGVLASCNTPAVKMIGPGAATDEAVMTTLLHAQLERLAGKTVVALVPSDARSLLAAAYDWGGRNVELHVVQSNAALPPARGVELGTFLPE